MVLTREQRTVLGDDAEPLDSMTQDRPKNEKKSIANKARASLDKITPGTSLPQNQSPLYSVLPTEIRLMIFKWTFSTKTVSVRRYPPSISTQEAGTIDTCLLRTCRLIFYEVRWLPAHTSMQRITLPLPYTSNFNYKMHIPRCRQGAYRLPSDMNSLFDISKMSIASRSQTSKLDVLQVKDPFHAGSLKYYILQLRIKPKKLFLTVPFYVSGQTPDPEEDKIFRSGCWRQVDRFFYAGLEELRVQWDALEKQKSQLQAYVDRLRERRVKIQGGLFLTTGQEEPESKPWTGPDRNFRWKSRVNNPKTGLASFSTYTPNWFSMTLTWKARSCE